MNRENLEWQKFLISIIDILSVCLSGYLASSLPFSDLSLRSLPILILAHLVAFFLSDFSRDFNDRSYADGFLATIKYSIYFLILTTFTSFMLEKDFIISRRGVVYVVLFNTVAMFLLNLLVKFYTNRVFPRSIHARKIYLITTEKRFDEMKRQGEKFFLRHDGSIVATTFIDGEKTEIDQAIHRVPIEAVGDYILKSVVDHIFINVPSEEFDIKEIVFLAENAGVPVSININSLDTQIVGEKKMQQLFGHEVITISSNFYKPTHLFLKRTLDIIGSLVGLMICLFVSLFIVPIIKKDGGPAIFAQDRVGKNGRVFKFYKFRSMRVDAESIKQSLMSENQMEGFMFKMDNDPRITKVGHFIRKTSLDELPQFWNVLKGDMSLVGTRPPTLDEYVEYSLEHKRRLSFKPGITGLWQVSGRSNITNFEEIVNLDVSYINNWTIWLDLKILFKTFWVVLRKDGSK